MEALHYGKVIQPILAEKVNSSLLSEDTVQLRIVRKNLPCGRII